MSERAAAIRDDPILRAATSAPAEAPITNAGAATAPPTSPESAPARRPASASAARLPQEYPRKPARSEERRVGKECRSRWSPDHLQKKGKLNPAADVVAPVVSVLDMD